jgi:hypothetical protein
MPVDVGDANQQVVGGRDGDIRRLDRLRQGQADAQRQDRAEAQGETFQAKPTASASLHHVRKASGGRLVGARLRRTSPLSARDRSVTYAAHARSPSRSGLGPVERWLSG